MVAVGKISVNQVLRVTEYQQSRIPCIIGRGGEVHSVVVELLGRLVDCLHNKARFGIPWLNSIPLHWNISVIGATCFNQAGDLVNKRLWVNFGRELELQLTAGVDAGTGIRAIAIRRYTCGACDDEETDYKRALHYDSKFCCGIPLKKVSLYFVVAGQEAEQRATRTAKTKTELSSHSRAWLVG